MASCIALMLAAGSGERAGGGVPKQYRALAGRPLIRHALARFAGHPGISGVRAVIRAGDRDLYDAAAEGLGLMAPIIGGAARQESARMGLESLADLKPDRVLIHDAARPFTTEETISRVLGALDTHPAALAAIPVHDTLKRAADEDAPTVSDTLPRDGLWLAQTPQGFRYADILAAHRAAAGEMLTDDAAVAERAGLSVALVAGDPDNLKVTTTSDFARAERIFAAALGDIRVGAGLDVHAFEPGARVTLCGIDIAHDQALAGHSDADVGLHALTDAIFGALGKGDIGQHFPPSDDTWRGARSEIFLRAAADEVAQAGGIIAHVDVTLICEAPKIGPHRAEMVARIAGILGIDQGRVSVKATTSEGLGFTGRREGIAAQATATIRLPSAV